MLQVKNISLHLKENDRPLLSDFSFFLERGDKAAIIGEEGNGKSTLLRLMYDGNVPYAEVTGAIVRKGNFGYLPQMMPAEEQALTPTQYLEDVPLYERYELLEELGLSDELISSERPISTLSGGEKIKLQLLKILLSGADTLFLDEPTGDLDIPSLCFLQEFIRNTSLPVVYISHDETLLSETATVIIHMEQIHKKSVCRATIANLTYREYVEARNLQFDRQTQLANKAQTEHKKKFQRWQQVFEKVQHAQKTVSRGNPHGGQLLKKKMHSLLAQKRKLDNEELPEDPDREECILTRFDQNCCIPVQKRVLEFSLPLLQAGGKTLSHDIELSVIGARRVCIVGANGAGKSTLLRKIYASLKDRTDITVGYMPQDYGEVLNPAQTPNEYFGAHYDKATMTRAMTYMGNMKFTADEMRRPIGTLSGGQRAKIIFLGMVLNNANVLLLDEPTRNFSPLSCPVVRRALTEFRGAVISVSHDRLFLEEVAEDIYLLDENGLKLL
ncbi:MAG: ATP-binding cassette domain-containing protein [Clostridia bacterium]|nr:ATP-binding cassette domain-containing protein [Clostridia bacterium]